MPSHSFQTAQTSFSFPTGTFARTKGMSYSASEKTLIYLLETSGDTDQQIIPWNGRLSLEDCTVF